MPDLNIPGFSDKPNTYMDQIRSDIQRLESASDTFEQTLTVVGSDELTITVPAGDTLPHLYSATFNHNLGYIPIFLAYASFSESTSFASYGQLPLYQGFFSPAELEAYTDSSTFNVILQQYTREVPGDTTWKVKFYLFREPASSSNA